MLHIQNLSLSIKGQPILDDISLQVNTGTLISIVGQNGAGKSTLLRAVLKMQPFQRGTIAIQTQNILSCSPKQLARQIAYLPQSLPVNQQCTVEDYVRMGNYPWDRVHSHDTIRQRLHRALTQCMIKDFRHRIVATLSGGERQRVFLAQVIMQSTPIILLDEPTRFLDLKNQILFEQILLSLRSEGKTIVNITHDLISALQISNQAALLQSGKIIKQGNPEDVINTIEISKGFNVPAEIIEQRLNFGNIWENEAWQVH